MTLVIHQRLAVDNYVVQEDEHELVEVLPEDIVLQRHEDARRVVQAHGQHVALEQALRRREGRLVAILFRDEDLAEARAQVDLLKYLALNSLSNSFSARGSG